jgi:O-antigen ligase
MAVAFGLAAWKGISGVYGEIGWLDMITYEKLAGTVAFQPIYLSFYVVFAFFALWFLYSMPRFGGQVFFGHKRLVYPLMFFFFAAVVMLSSRMEIMVLFATFAVMILTYAGKEGARRRKYLIAFTIMLILAVLMITGSKENKQRFTEMVDVEADYTQNKYGGRSIRFHKWLNTIECWSEQWLIGTGTGDMQHELNETYRKNEFSLALQYSFNPHNQYLETLLTLGLPGFSLLGSWMLSLVVAGWRSKNALLLAFGLIVSMSMITESMLERHWGLVFIALFSAVLLTDNFKYFSDQSASVE